MTDGLVYCPRCGRVYFNSKETLCPSCSGKRNDPVNFGWTSSDDERQALGETFKLKAVPRDESS